MSKTKSLHHIVFATKSRKRTIIHQYKKELYAYIMGIINNNKCHLLRINGMPDHIHILVDLHPTVCVSSLVKDIKQCSCNWLRGNEKFPLFESWGEGYYAVSIGVDDMERCRSYIINQETHHNSEDLLIEMQHMASVHGLDWHPDDWA